MMCMSLKDAVKLIIAQYESQAQASRELKISRSYLNRILRGSKCNPSPETLKKMGLEKFVTYQLKERNK